MTGYSGLFHGTTGDIEYKKEIIAKLQKEKKKLDKKIKKLNKVFKSPTDYNITENHYNLLENQLECMKGYSDALDMRICDLEDNIPHAKEV